MWVLPEPSPRRTPKRVAVVTSGGDAPGMNAALRAVVRTAASRGIEVLGANRGYTGLVQDSYRPLGVSSVGNILHRGGTLLKSDRSDAFRQPSVRAQVAERLRQHGIEALIVIGGDGSLTGAHLLTHETGFPVLGLPASIDNDIIGTDHTIGFDTAMNTALEAIDRIRDTAHSHERVFLVEVMGRSSGFLATAVGIAAGAEIILMPDCEVNLPSLLAGLTASRLRGKTSSLIVVAEGKDPSATPRLAAQLSDHGHQARACILGHLQRGGSPSGQDRLLASCLGESAIRYLCAGIDGVMLGVREGRVCTTPLTEVIQGRKAERPELLDLARVLSS